MRSSEDRIDGTRTAPVPPRNGRYVPVPGGVLVRDADGVIGAVGVSGDTADRDGERAVAGVRAEDLEPAPAGT